MSVKGRSDDELDEEFEIDANTVTFGYLDCADSARTTGPAVEVPRRRRRKSADTDRSSELKRKPLSPDHNALDAAGEFKIGHVPELAPKAAPPSPPRRQPVPSTQAPVVFSSREVASSSLTGSTRADGSPPSGERPTRQWSGPILRLQAPRPTSPDRIGHRVEVRAFVFFDSRDVIRYGIFIDPDLGLGFDGTGRAASYSVRVREMNLYRYGIGGPGRVEFAVAGRLKVVGFGELSFEGGLSFDATGEVAFNKPRITQGTGQLIMEEGTVVIGWPTTN